jgi:hypothetical protein
VIRSLVAARSFLAVAVTAAAVAALGIDLAHTAYTAAQTAQLILVQTT